jgi:hypothetical protein
MLILLRDLVKETQVFLEHELDGMVAGPLHLKQNVSQESA